MIKLDNITKYYHSVNSVVPALRKIRLDFKIGEFVVITGESGSGKSTLLNVISGLDTYDEGELLYNGEATSHFDDDDWEEYRKSKIGFVFQNYNLIDNYSTLYNVESALLIQGYEYKEARKRAKELIKRVGLKEQMNQRASKLSSGQKQRLSIARALAKDTDIIVADEPTGSLDPLAGKQIMELFAQLSKDKLVIVVTHNYEETAPYVTRKIRLHEGEIVSDTVIDNPVMEQITEEVSKEHKNKGKQLAKESKNPVKRTKHNITSDTRIAWRFTRMNIMTQARRVFLFLFSLVVTTFVSFIFLGEIFSKMDDIITKDYNTKAFLNSDNTRLVVKKANDSPITNEDLNAFNKIKYVKMSDMYDYANDINYYINFGEDYDYNYQPKAIPKSEMNSKTVNFIQSTKFMKSSTCITKEDLSAGRLPDKQNEIVLYSEDKSTLGKSIICYFTSQNIWANDNNYSSTLNVVGLLKHKSDQVYFSGDLCNMLSIGMYNDNYYLMFGKNNNTGEYDVQLPVLPVPGEGLQDGEIRVSVNMPITLSYPIPKNAIFSINRGTDISVNGKDGQNLNVEIQDQYDTHSIKFIEISEGWYKKFCNYKSNQASIYIKDYIYTDYVLAKLKKLGYEAISSYRIGSAGYNSSKIEERNAALMRAVIVLLVLGIFEILIVGTYLRLKYRNYTVFTSMGMKLNTVKMINFFEMLIFAVASIAITMITAKLLAAFGMEFIYNRSKYYDYKHELIFIAFNVIIELSTVVFFNRYLKHRQKWG